METRYKGYYITRREITHKGITGKARVGIDYTYFMRDDGMQDEKEEKVTFLSWLISVNEFFNKLTEYDKKQKI